MDRRIRWTAIAAAVLVAIGVGIASYNLGVSHGLAVSSGNSVPAGAFGPYGWHRPWGFGFFSPLFFLLFWFLLFRVFFWGGFHRRRYSYGPDEGPSRLDDWHRRAHERMNQTRTTGESGGNA